MCSKNHSHFTSDTFKVKKDKTCYFHKFESFAVFKLNFLKVVLAVFAWLTKGYSALLWQF
jgi:hypothetical protein